MSHISFFQNAQAPPPASPSPALIILKGIREPTLCVLIFGKFPDEAS